MVGTNGTNTMWLFAIPYNASNYDGYIQISYFIQKGDSGGGSESTVTVNVGNIEEYQVIMIACILGFMLLMATCIITRFCCKLGIPRDRPWEAYDKQRAYQRELENEAHAKRMRQEKSKSGWYQDKSDKETMGTWKESSYRDTGGRSKNFTLQSERDALSHDRRVDAYHGKEGIVRIISFV